MYCSVRRQSTRMPTASASAAPPSVMDTGFLQQTAICT